MESFKVGEAPWEQSTSTGFKVGEAPWEQESEKIVNEMPDGLKGRFVYKNFGADPVASFNYLQKENPDFELKKNKSGEVLARKKGTQNWGRLDPEGLDWRDLTDIAYDAPAALAQGAVTAASGIAGAAAGGIGAIPAAMVGSAVSGAALEGLRQGIGSYFIDDNMSAQDMGIALVAGAASPLLFGTGAGAKEALKAAGKEGAKQTAKEILQTQRGVLGRGYDATAGYVGPKLGTVVSGENPKVIKKAAGMLKEIIEADRNPEVTTIPLAKAAQEINSTLKQKATKTGRRMEELRGMIDQQPGLILTGEGAAVKGTGFIPKNAITEPFEALVTELKKGFSPTEAQLADLNSLANILKKETEGLAENLTAAQAETVRRRFKERVNQYGLNHANAAKATGATGGASAIDVPIALAFEQARRNVDESYETALRNMDPNFADEYVGLKDAYSSIKNLQKDIDSKTKNSKSLSNFLTQATKDRHAEQQMMEIVKLTGLDLPELAHREQAIRVFSKPSTAVRSLGGATSTSRTLPLATGGGAAGYYLGQQLGWSPFLSSVIGGTLGATAGSPAAMRKYMETNQFLRKTLPTEGLGLIPYSQEILRSTPYLMMNTNLHDQGEK
jgi:hypothetical protein